MKNELPRSLLRGINFFTNRNAASCGELTPRPANHASGGSRKSRLWRIPPQAGMREGGIKLPGLTKEGIRSKILLKLKTQNKEDRNRKSSLIKEKLLKTRVFKKAKIVMFYIAFGGEVETKEMIEEAKKTGKIVTVPVSGKNKIALRPSILDDDTAFKKGPYGVYEPAAANFVPLGVLDLVIAPGVAFDKKGNRLGRGKGCYDHLLQSIPKDTPTVGLAFDFQILPAIPSTTRDIAVKKVISA